MLLWGSNAREAHPIFFHHLMKGLKNGARMYAVDPRRTSSSKFADVWLGLDVGPDIALANGVAREIISAGLVDEAFIAHSTDGYEIYKASVEPYTLEMVAGITGCDIVEVSTPELDDIVRLDDRYGRVEAKNE